MLISIQKHDTLNQNEFGFRQIWSCIDAVKELMEEIMDNKIFGQ